MNELSLFAGAGGGILGGILNGWKTVCAVEIDEYCRRVLMQRQDDGILEPFPVWDDIRTFDGRPWSGCVDIVTGGFPCQDISIAGKGKGLDGQRSGLWSEMARVISEVRPRYALIENSPMLIVRGLDRVLCDLAEMGYDARWGIVSASNAGARHERKRLWIMADTHGTGLKERDMSTKGSGFNTWEDIEGQMANTDNTDRWRECWWERCVQISTEKRNTCTAFDQPEPIRMVDGIPNRMDRLKCIGNAQVPRVVELAWEILK